jgi:hypothetical protein
VFGGHLALAGRCRALAARDATGPCVAAPEGAALLAGVPPAEALAVLAELDHPLQAALVPPAPAPAPAPALARPR